MGGLATIPTRTGLMRPTKSWPGRPATATSPTLPGACSRSSRSSRIVTGVWLSRLPRFRSYGGIRDRNA